MVPSGIPLLMQWLARFWHHDFGRWEDHGKIGCPSRSRRNLALGPIARAFGQKTGGIPGVGAPLVAHLIIDVPSSYSAALPGRLTVP
jgi:hypothetical protein